MSYDISFKVKVEGADLYVPVGDCEANSTWNVREMIVKATGLEWKNEANNGLCKDVIPKIQKGYNELINHGSRYKKYEAQNCWGTVYGTMKFFEEILHAWRDLKMYDPEIADIATFWIE